MNAELRQSFARLKPVCDVVMIRPSEDSVRKFLAKVAELRREIVQELQQYLLFPFITHLKSTEMERKYETQWLLIDGMREVLERVSVNSFEMCLKIETTLLQLIFDNSKPGMIAEVPEELKHSVMKCLTTLMINIEKKYREKLLKTQVPLLAQAIFVSVHIAKLEKFRALRLQALYCVMAHTATHPQLTTDKYRIADAGLENKVVDMLASILPGVLAALQDVATCTNNPGHAIVVAAIEAIHRILCLVMQDKYLKKRETVTAQDFLRMFPQQVKHDEAHCKEAIKDVEKRSCEWYSMAGGKLTIITKSLLPLRTHEHFKVRRELAVYSARILNECTLTMQPSMNVVLDILISLSKDEYPVVSQYCLEAVSGYFENAPPETRHRTMDNLSENLFVMLNGLPRVLNNIDNNRKLYALNLLHGYLHMMCDDGRPQRLTLALSPHNNMRRLCAALLAASAPRPPALLAHHSRAELTTPLLPESPWSKLQHLDPGPCSARLEDILALLGGAECAELVLDRLLQLLHQERCPNVLYAINHMAKGAGSTRSFIERALDAYIAEDMWYLPLEVAAAEPPLTKYDTRDPAVYNPRAWTRDSVPGLYEGTVETRYTDVGYSAPRPPPRLQPNVAASLAHAQRNIVMSCLLTEGLGFMAQRLGADFQPYLLKTLCLVLERVGSKYSLIHLAGLGALQRVALAGGHASVSALVAHNADYFTHQVTLRLKKSWDSESALQILSVVMEYSDPSVLDCLYGIVKDVLVQSCDKYYEKNLYSYLQVFLTFVTCLHKWFPVKDKVKTDGGTACAQLDITKELLEFIDDIEKTERLMNDDEFEEETGKTVEEMYREDLKRKEDDILDYDDKVTDEKPPLPQHIVVTLSILRRCVHFVGATAREPALLALRLLARGLPLLRGRDDELLPLVHQAWAPLVPRFNTDEPVVLRRALDLLVVMAEMSKDFIHGRCVKEVLPNLYEYLHKSAADSHLKDAGSYYRSSAAYVLQLAVLEALPTLALQLRLRDNDLEAAMACVDYYLSNKQPRPLQAAAVKFFKDILEYDHGAAWYHLRTACDNTRVLAPPPLAVLPLEPVVGTPYEPSLGEREANIVAIFSPAPT